MTKPLMAKATAVWLVDNTTLTFRQIAEFCGMHELEVQGIADGDVAVGVKGFDPVASSQLDPKEIEKGEADPIYKLKLKFNAAAVGEDKRRGPRYTPLSKRQDRPNAILWLLRNHPEMKDARWRIEHAQHLSIDDIPRFATLGVIASMQGIHATSDAPYVLARLGPERAEAGAYVWKKFLDAGVIVSNGTDVPVERIDPIANWHCRRL